MQVQWGTFSVDSWALLLTVGLAFLGIALQLSGYRNAKLARVLFIISVLLVLAWSLYVISAMGAPSTDSMLLGSEEDLGVQRATSVEFARFEKVIGLIGFLLVLGVMFFPVWIFYDLTFGLVKRTRASSCMYKIEVVALGLRKPGRGSNMVPHDLSPLLHTVRVCSWKASTKKLFSKRLRNELESLALDFVGLAERGSWSAGELNTLADALDEWVLKTKGYLRHPPSPPRRIELARNDEDLG